MTKQATHQVRCWPDGGGVSWIETRMEPATLLEPHEAAMLALLPTLTTEQCNLLSAVLGGWNSAGDVKWLLGEASRHLSLGGDLCPADNSGRTCLYCKAGAGQHG